MNWSEKMLEPVATAWMQNGVMVNAFNHPPCSPEQWAAKDYGGYWSSRGYSEEPLYRCNKAREIAALVEAGNAVIAWCDKNPPAGDALWCVQQLRQSLAALEDEK